MRPALPVCSSCIHESVLVPRSTESRIQQEVVKNLFVVFLLLGVLAFGFPGAVVYAGTAALPSRTWKTVAELSPQERARIGFSPVTWRHAEFPYLPAELFPFAPAGPLRS